MKNLISTLLTTLLLGYGAFAADGNKKSDDGDKVYYAVKAQFNSDFTDAQNVSWTVNSQFQKADFIEDGLKMAAYYDLNGQYMGVTKQVSFNELPSLAKKELAVKYKGFFADEVVRFETASSILPSLDRYAVNNNEVYIVKLSKDAEQHVLRVYPTSTIEIVK